MTWTISHTTASPSSGAQPGEGVSAVGAMQKVVVVNGSAQMVELLETVLEAGRYDVVFVESNDHAYSQIKRVQPHLVILCVHFDEAEGFQVLSMLKIDKDTRRIPVLTYTTDGSAEDGGEEETDDSPGEMLAPRMAMRMN